jgi:hypothetical protein
MTGSLGRPLAAEKLLTGYNVAMALLWAVFITRVPHAPWLALAHAVAVPLPWLFARAMPTASRPFRFLRELSPLLFLGVFWLELDLIRPVLGLTGIDAPIAALDRLLTGGVHLHQVWLPAMHGRLFSEAMYFMYWAYYFAVYVPPIVLALMARYEPARDTVYRLVLVYLGCYVMFIAFPVDGPHFLEEAFQGPHTAGFFYGLVEGAQGFGDSRGCSFPSSHVAAAVMGAMLAWRWLPRWIAVILWIEADRRAALDLLHAAPLCHRLVGGVRVGGGGVGARRAGRPVARNDGSDGNDGNDGMMVEVGLRMRDESR